MSQELRLTPKRKLPAGQHGALKTAHRTSAARALALAIGCASLVATACSAEADEGPSPEHAGAASGTGSDIGSGASGAGNRGGTSANAGGTASGGNAGGQPESKRCNASEMQPLLDLQYKTEPGVDPALLSLDVYRPVLSSECPAAPILIYVHGGAFTSGDKATPAALTNKLAWAKQRGYVLVSINYRLSPPLDVTDLPETPADLDPDRLMYPAHYEDAADAVNWVLDRASEYAGDPNQTILIGHSAGAIIVSAIATDDSFLARGGRSLDTLTCTIALDTEGYDIAAQASSTRDLRWMYLNAFGNDPDTWREASAIEHAAPGKDVPSFFVVTRGAEHRVDNSQRFVNALEQAGVSAKLIEAQQYDHGDVNHQVGAPGDALITPPLEQFLAENACD